MSTLSYIIYKLGSPLSSPSFPPRMQRSLRFQRINACRLVEDQGFDCPILDAILLFPRFSSFRRLFSNRESHPASSCFLRSRRVITNLLLSTWNSIFLWNRYLLSMIFLSFVSRENDSQYSSKWNIDNFYQKLKLQLGKLFSSISRTTISTRSIRGLFSSRREINACVEVRAFASGAVWPPICFSEK